jgi:uncharacterized damage-inducible protein DinB
MRDSRSAVECMQRTFRSGNIGALMDEYERAAGVLKHLVEAIPEDKFVEILDSATRDADCRSVQTIMAHVVGAGYAYADYLRELFSIRPDRPSPQAFSHRESLARLDEMLAYTVQTLEGKWIMSDAEITASVIHSRWGVTYDAEQLLEHAIVHVLRHRRQVEKLIASANLNLS